MLEDGSQMPHTPAYKVWLLAVAARANWVGFTQVTERSFVEVGIEDVFFGVYVCRMP